jgi:hypothetical protein
MVLPATGAVLDVIVVLVWLPNEDNLLTKLAHCTAVTVSAAATVGMAGSPYPKSAVPVLHTLFMLLLLVLTKPL